VYVVGKRTLLYAGISGILIQVGTTDFFFSKESPDHIWGWSSHLLNGYCRIFLLGLSGWGVRLIIYFHLVPRIRV